MQCAIVQLFIQHDDIPRDYELEVADWKNLSYLKVVLEPLKEATQT